MYKTFSSTSIGETHVRNNKPCQDYSLNYNFRNGSYYIIAVADGHGGDKYFRSQKGSEFACKAAKECAVKCMRENDFVETISCLICKQSKISAVKSKFPNGNYDPQSEFNNNAKKIDSLLVQLEKSIIGAWSQKVFDDINENEFNDEELKVYDEDKRERVKNTDYGTKAYGTTLKLAVICENFWFGLHIGDGTFVTVSEDGVFDNPIELDEKCVGNFVTSICDNDAISLFHHA
jgi:serine/threonine protein phosphatase PrpC